MLVVNNSVYILMSGYGHWRVTVYTIDGDMLYATTTDSRTIDRFYSDDDEERDKAKERLIDYVLSRNGITDYELYPKTL